MNVKYILKYDLLIRLGNEYKRCKEILFFELKFIRFVRYIQFGCVISEEETPDPIPNSEVKLFSAEGSAREAWCEKRSMHPLIFKKPKLSWAFLF